MHAAARQLRPLVQVGLPVAVAVVLVCLAVLNMALVKTWPGEADDGVLWQSSGPNTPVIATDVARGSAGARAGIQKRDELLLLNNQDVTSPKQVEAALHRATTGQRFIYLISRQSTEQAISVELQPLPALRHGLYYSLALVGVNASTPKNATVSQKKCSVAGSFGRRSRTDDPTTIDSTPTSASE